MRYRAPSQQGGVRKAVPWGRKRRPRGGSSERKTGLPRDPAAPRLGLYPENAGTFIHKDTCTLMSLQQCSRGQDTETAGWRVKKTRPVPAVGRHSATEETDQLLRPRGCVWRTACWGTSQKELRTTRFHLHVG